MREGARERKSDTCDLFSIFHAFKSKNPLKISRANVITLDLNVT